MECISVVNDSFSFLFLKQSYCKTYLPDIERMISEESNYWPAPSKKTTKEIAEFTEIVLQQIIKYGRIVLRHHLHDKMWSETNYEFD